MLNVWILEEQQLWGELFRLALHERPGLQIGGALPLTTDSKTLVACLTQAHPDLIILGFKTLDHRSEEILKSLPHREVRRTSVIFFFNSYTMTSIRRLKEAGRWAEGGSAYLLKHNIDTADQIERLVRSVAEGRLIIDPEIMSALLGDGEPGADQIKGLTPRELEVLSWVAKGARNETIAAGLSLESRTVERHVNSIYTKLCIGPELVNGRVCSTLLYLQANGLLRRSQRGSADPQIATNGNGIDNGHSKNQGALQLSQQKSPPENEAVAVTLA